jgi:hypothetical protein
MRHQTSASNPSQVDEDIPFSFKTIKPKTVLEWLLKRFQGQEWEIGITISKNMLYSSSGPKRSMHFIVSILFFQFKQTSKLILEYSKACVCSVHIESKSKKFCIFHETDCVLCKNTKA